MDAALRQQHEQDPVKYPVPYLPKAYRGRCHPRRVLQRPLAHTLRPGRNGDYAPKEEATSVRSRQRTRQVRRAQTLLRGLRKAHQAGTLQDPPVLQQLSDEWRAILRAPGYPGGFSTWLLQCVQFSSIPVGLPDLEFLSVMFQYIRYDCDSVVAMEARDRVLRHKHRMLLDCRHGGSALAYRTLKREPLPPFTQVPHTLTCEVKRRGPSEGSGDAVGFQFALSRPTPFQQGAALLDGHECFIVSAGPDVVSLASVIHVDKGILSQSIVATTPDELGLAFSEFWGPLWNRDPSASSMALDDWPEYRAFDSQLLGLPSVRPLPSVTIEHWQRAVKRMSAKSAPGVCGWHSSEVKLLPLEALELLATLFRSAIQVGLPSHLLQARVCVLAKVPLPTSLRQSRPITVFSVLYRLWSSATTRAILDHWSEYCPPSLAGSMPTKDCLTLSYRQLAEIEQARLDRSGRLGFSIDIVKCFNQLAWPILWDLMARLGIPDDILRFWLSSLRQVARRPSFSGSLTAAVAACNGAPEGDPLSVAAMCAVCFATHTLMQGTGAQFDSFVDNWAWSSASVEPISTALPLAVSWLSALKLPVDWSKSYAWATTRELRVWWGRHAATLLNGEGPLKLWAVFVNWGAFTPFRAELTAPRGRLVWRMVLLALEAPRPAFALAPESRSPTNQCVACLPLWPRVSCLARASLCTAAGIGG